MVFFFILSKHCSSLFALYGQFLESTVYTQASRLAKRINSFVKREEENFLERFLFQSINELFFTLFQQVPFMTGE